MLHIRPLLHVVLGRRAARAGAALVTCPCLGHREADRRCPFGRIEGSRFEKLLLRVPELIRTTVGLMACAQHDFSSKAVRLYVVSGCSHIPKAPVACRQWTGARCSLLPWCNSDIEMRAITHRSLHGWLGDRLDRYQPACDCPSDVHLLQITTVRASIRGPKGDGVPLKTAVTADDSYRKLRRASATRPMPRCLVYPAGCRERQR